MNVKNVQIKVGLTANKKRADNARSPGIYFWMLKNSGDKSNPFTEASPGALWIDINPDKCPEDKKTKGYEFINGFLQALEMGWIKVKGNLEAEAIFEALAEDGPPESPDPFGGSTPEPEDDSSLPF